MIACFHHAQRVSSNSVFLRFTDECRAVKCDGVAARTRRQQQVNLCAILPLDLMSMCHHCRISRRDFLSTNFLADDSSRLVIFATRRFCLFHLCTTAWRRRANFSLSFITSPLFRSIAPFLRTLRYWQHVTIPPRSKSFSKDAGMVLTGSSASSPSSRMLGHQAPRHPRRRAVVTLLQATSG